MRNFNLGMRLCLTMILAMPLTSSKAFAASVSDRRLLRANSPGSLREALQLAIERNPETQSNELKILALAEGVKGVESEKYPNLALGCSSRTNFQVGGYSANSIKPNCGVSGSVTLYDGGANKYRAKAAQSRLNATAQLYNSASPYVQHGRGSLANQTMLTYMNLVIEKLDSIEEAMDSVILQKILSIATTLDEKNLVEAKITTLKGTQAQTIAKYSQAQKAFLYYVTVSPGTQLENLEETILHLPIPITFQEAVNIALDANTDVLAAKGSLEAAQYTLKAVKAALGPRITAGFSVDRVNEAESAFGDSYSYRKSVGINFTVPLISRSQRHAVRSQSITNQAAAMDVETAINDVKYETEKSYDKLAAAVIQEGLALQAYNQALQVMDGTIQKIDAHSANLPSISTCLTQLGNLSYAYQVLIGKQAEILALHFSIQQLLGSVFNLIP